MTRPDRFIGLHLFNPVSASSLVEIVVGAKTDPALVEHDTELVTLLGKTAITVT